MQSWLSLVIFMENDKISITLFIRRLNRPFFHFSKDFRSAIKNDGFILENYRNDSVEEEALINLLKKSVFFPSIRYFLPDILYLTKEESITEHVFFACYKYPGRYRTTLLNLLAHMWLPEAHLIRLTKIIDAPEAFCKLFVMYAESESIPIDEFVSFLRTNSNYLETVDISRLIRDNNICISQDKEKALIQFLGKC